MAFTANSKIRTVWQHPVGHDVLYALLCQLGYNERWVRNPLVGGLPLSALDRIAGAGFADMLLEMLNNEPRAPLPPPEDEPHTWWKEAVVYQIYPPSFMDSDHDGVGDLCGIVQRLPYLAKLGIDTICLWPVLEAAPALGRATRNFMQISPELGTLEDFETLVQAAAARGIKVLLGLDIMYTSDEHPWFQKALHQCSEEYQGYYFFQRGNPDAPPNNWGKGTSCAWAWYPEVCSWGLRISGRNRMDLNWDNPEVRAQMGAVLQFWQKKGVDGFFLGSANLINKSSMRDGCPQISVGGLLGYEHYTCGARMHTYLQELRASLHNNSALLVGEVRGVGTEMAKMFTSPQGEELDMVLDGTHLLPRRIKGEEQPFSLYDLKRYYLRWIQHYGGQHWMSLFLETAETGRIISRVGASPVYRGMLAKLFATLQLTLRGTPVLYQGQELGLGNTRFTGIAELRDPAALRLYNEQRERLGEQAAFEAALHKTTDHARTPIPWSTGPRGGFTGAEPWLRLPDGIEHLNASAQMEDGASVWRHYQKLISLRKKNAALLYGSINPVFVNSKHTFCYFRIYEGKKWYVELNLSEKECVRPGRILPTHKLMLGNYETPARTLRPYEANLYKCD